MARRDRLRVDIKVCKEISSPSFSFAQKIILVLLRELWSFAQNSFKDEFAALEPLLRNVGAWCYARTA